MWMPEIITESKMTGLDFANMAYRFRRKKDQRTASYYLRKVRNAYYQTEKYKRRKKN